mmetsp:Transcript_50333/g.93026  ORF Transcript_50333/g.93026 Transcript_50333/m.93026 type:complete len:121 (-) Transcript_50333:949-1311(-)
MLIWHLESLPVPFSYCVLSAIPLVRRGLGKVQPVLPSDNYRESGKDESSTTHFLRLLFFGILLYLPPLSLTTFRSVSASSLRQYRFLTFETIAFFTILHLITGSEEKESDLDKKVSLIGQ